MADLKKGKIDSFRMTMCSAIITAVMGIALYLHANKVQDVIAKLNEKGKLNNVEWVVEYASYLLPVAFAAIAMAVFYSIFNKGSSVAAYKERSIASIILIAVTYGVMLPIIFSKKKIVDEKEIKLIDICVKWFAFQFVPLLVMAIYNISRVEYEKRIAAEEENDNVGPNSKKDDIKEENN